jgi:hypothetical protein
VNGEAGLAHPQETEVPERFLRPVRGYLVAIDSAANPDATSLQLCINCFGAAATLVETRRDGLRGRVADWVERACFRARRATTK